MNDFNPDRFNEAAAKLKALTGVNVRPDPVREIQREAVSAKVTKMLQNPAFVCEAFSEIPDNILKVIGAASANQARERDASIGLVVQTCIHDYATKCAESELQWECFDAQRQFEQELRDNEDDARRAA